MDKMLNGSPKEITVDVNGEYRVRRPFRKVLRTLKEVDKNKNIFSYKEVSYYQTLICITRGPWTATLALIRVMIYKFASRIQEFVVHICS